ncbi:sensor histidine kinase [Roseibium denhamense]|uniref:histidine kinase n=1 Tax=Roseibium denhamense TaxID=76305 RepID=A0ABY1PBK1_9HYPH|nr:ATP-binding protein [Roseibium denhamense]SMP29918.1 two-component system, NtrC family, C4-dicarboxylate transport sensor histidine kinase DctB [Roseibium denhamense]
MSKAPAPLFRFTSGRVLAGFVLLSALIALLSEPAIETYFQEQAGARGKDTLQLTVEGLKGALQRYEPLPSLIAERPSLVALLKSPADPDLLKRVNEDLRLAAYRLKASDVYVMDASGMTLAASSYQKELSFVGRSFAYRPYFTQALEGGTGRFFALGTTSGERGYFFAAPIEDNERVIGVVAVKFTVDGFEQAWRNADHQIIVSDLKGVVFMASREDWHFRTLEPLTRTAMAEIRANRQYPEDRLDSLVNTVSPLGEDLSLITIDEDGSGVRYISSAAYISDAGWNVRILVPANRARTQALAAVLILVLAIMLIGLAVAFYIQRRTQLLERLLTQQAAQEQLEVRVAERTADLNRTNAQLLDEVAERKAAETRLRKTQTELVQAGKLAALGQMSAALSHEFNQPLAAVKSYADNALKLLDIGRTSDTRENISRISEMADRMASISKHLRNFARRPMEKVRPVPLVQIVNDAVALLQPRLRSSEARLAFSPPLEDVWVMGGHIRLQQVVVNLLTNALDAMKDEPSPRIDIAIEESAGKCLLTVRDYGKGLPDEEAGQVFDPFFTTKQPGEGMGLGLSISYNIVKDFDGHLRARNHPEGGAVFEIELVDARGSETDASSRYAQETAAE